MNQDAHDQFTLDQALEIIAVRVIGDDVSVYETDINSGARK